MIVELTCDKPEAIAADLVKARREAAHRTLKNWLAGDHTSNNSYR